MGLVDRFTFANRCGATREGLGSTDTGHDILGVYGYRAALGSKSKPGRLSADNVAMAGESSGDTTTEGDFGPILVEVGYGVQQGENMDKKAEWECECESE